MQELVDQGIKMVGALDGRLMRKWLRKIEGKIDGYEGIWT